MLNKRCFCLLFKQVSYICIRMEKIKPIKRSTELAPLSRDHHSGLLFCWKIKTGIQKGISAEQITDYVAFYYKNHLQEHFSEEEKYVFPLLPVEHEMSIRAYKEHKDIVSQIQSLASGKNVNYATLEQLEGLLNSHIRFEERQIFPYIEEISDKDNFAKAGDLIAALHEGINEPIWEDEFWITTV